MVTPSANYGWPDIIADEAAKGMENLILHTWDCTQAPSGSEFYYKDKILQLGDRYFVEQIPNIPDWVRKKAKWRSLTLISDDEFTLGLEYIIKHKIITIQSNVLSDENTEQNLPHDCGKMLNCGVRDRYQTMNSERAFNG